MNQRLSCLNLTDWSGRATGKRNILSGAILFGDQTFYRSATLFSAVWSCLIVFDRFWIHLNAIKHSIKQLKTFPLFSCFMGDVLFLNLDSRITYVWCAHASRPAPRLVSIVCSSAAWIHCLICVLTVWPLTSTSAYLVTKQCFMMFGRQTCPVCTGL